MNAQDRKNMAEFTAALKLEFAAQLQPLVDKLIELEQRSSNFAARVSSHNACYRSEIAALREEIAGLKAGKKFVPAAQRISPALWKQAHAELCALHPGKTYFPSTQVRAYAENIVKAMDLIVPTPECHLDEEDEFAI